MVPMVSKLDGGELDVVLPDFGRLNSDDAKLIAPVLGTPDV